MSLNKIVQPVNGQQLNIIVNTIHSEEGLTVTCYQDGESLNLVPPLIGNVGQVLTRTGSNSVEFADIPGSEGILTNPLGSNLNIGAFDVVGLDFGSTLNGINLTQQTQKPYIDSMINKTANINESLTSFEYTVVDGVIRTSTGFASPQYGSPLFQSKILIDEVSTNVQSESFLFNGNSVATINDISTITLSSIGVGDSLVYSDIGPDLSIKSLINGDGITIFNTGTSLEISNSDHANVLALEDETTSLNLRALTLEQKTQFQTSETLTGKTIFSGVAGVQSTKFLLQSGGPNQFLKADGSIDSNVYALNSGLTTANNNITSLQNNVVTLQTKTQNMTATTTSTTFTGTSGITSDKFIKTGGTSLDFLKANGDIDTNSYIIGSSITNSSVPYINSTGGISGSNKNLFVMLGVNTIQSAIDVIPVGGSIFVSSGGNIEDITCSKQNYVLSGTPCPPFTQTTQITGNLIIGSTGFTSTRVRVSHMKFVGNLSFFNSLTLQELRTYFYNCDWSGSITFPTQTITSTGLAIYFYDCLISSTFTIPNQSLYTIYFTRCIFSGQSITNQLTAGNFSKLIFSDCGGLPTLSTLGFCLLNGLNTTLTTTQGNFGTVVLGGSNSNLLRADGSSITSSSFVSTIVGPIGYAGRKFMTTVPIAPITSGPVTNVNLIGTLNPIGGNAFVANECKIGDIYKITIVGVLDSQSTVNIATFTFGFLGSTNTVENTVGIGFTASAFKMEVEYQILTATTASFSGFFNVKNIVTPQTFFFGNSNKNTVVNLTASTNLTATFSHNSTTFSLLINGFNMIKY